MRLPTWKFRNVKEDQEENARRLHEAAWPDMFANLQSAYAELTNAQFELERRTAEISETRDLFQQVITSMSEALFLTDRSGRVIRTNPAGAALLETEETSILGRPLTAVCGSDDIPSTPWKLMEIAPAGRISNFDTDIRTMSGAVVPVKFSLGLMHDKQNKIIGVLAVARDLREQPSEINNLNANFSRFHEKLEEGNDPNDADNLLAEVKATLEGLEEELITKALNRVDESRKEIEASSARTRTLREETNKLLASIGG